jgi:Mn2+/Fe2+ NRAMP family transporter
MGSWVNRPFVTVLGWLVVGLMVVSGVAAIISLF